MTDLKSINAIKSALLLDNIYDCRYEIISNKKIQIINKENTYSAILKKTGVEIQYIGTGSTGIIYKIILLCGKEIALKIVPYIMNDLYGDVNNVNRPEIIETRILNDFNKIEKKDMSRHITNYYLTIKYHGIPKFHNDDKQITDFIKDKIITKGLYNLSHIIVYEWINGGTLCDFIISKNACVTLLMWKVLLFQLLFSLATIQYLYKGFRHNDLSIKNILIKKCNFSDKNHIYTILGTTFNVPQLGFCVKMWDYDFSYIPKTHENIKVYTGWSILYGIKVIKNNYYDLHFLLNSIYRAFKFDTNPDIPKEVVCFIEFALPIQYRGAKMTDSVNYFRYMNDEEYITPLQPIPSVCIDLY